MGGEALKCRHSQKVLFSLLIVPAEVVPGGTLRWSATCVSGVGRLYPPSSPPPNYRSFQSERSEEHIIAPQSFSTFAADPARLEIKQRGF